MDYSTQLELFRVDWINKWNAYREAREALCIDENASLDNEVCQKLEHLKQEYIKADKWYHERAAAFDKYQRSLLYPHSPIKGTQTHHFDS